MSVDHLVGQTLGQYTLQDLIGTGGMGAVYRAYQESLDRNVAVKVLPSDLADQSGYVARFEREARISAGLEHRHIVPVYDFGVEGNLSYVVMRLLTGGTLGQWLREADMDERPRPTIEQTVTMIRELASALDYAHERGVIHRDVKPGNVMFDDQGSAYLVDFGIARLARPDTPTTGPNLVPTLGTPSYMPPEQWRAEKLTPAADQYALAVVAYVLLTGKLPFEAETLYQMMHKHLHEAPPPLEIVRTDLPAAISPVLQRALSKEPEHRFPSVTEFAEALERAVDGADNGDTDATLERVPTSPQVFADTTPHLHVAPPRPLPRPALLLGALIGLLVVAAVGFALLRPGQPVERVDALGTSGPLPTRTGISAAATHPLPTSVGMVVTDSMPQIEPTSVTSIAMTLTALRSDALTRNPRPTDAPILPTPVPAQTESSIIGPVITPSLLPLSPVGGVSSTMPTPEPDNLPTGFLRADLLGHVFRLSPDGVPFIYAFAPDDFTGIEPYLTINVDNYPARYRPASNAQPIGYLTKNQSYPILRTYQGYAFVRGSKFSGWIVLDPQAMTIHGDVG